MARSKGRTYRGFKIKLDRTDRYEVFEKDGDAPIADRFGEISEAMNWIDATQFATL